MSSNPQESTQSSGSSTPASGVNSKPAVSPPDLSTSALGVNLAQTSPGADLSSPASVVNSKPAVSPPDLSTSAPGTGSKTIVPPLAISNKSKFWGMSLYELLTLGIQGFGVAAALATLVFLGRQVQDQSAATKAQTQALWSSTYQGVMDKQFELDKFFVEDPKLDLYFFKQPEEFEGKVINRKDVEYRKKAIHLADYYLDFFVMVWSQKEFIPELNKPKDKSWQAWENYMKATFENSIVLCDQLNDIQNSFDQEFVEDVNKNKWCEGKLVFQRK